MPPSITCLLKPARLGALVVMLGSLLLSHSSVSAATITWGPATNISAVGDVSTAGTFVDSATFNSVDQTVNGVIFNHANTASTSTTFANGSNIAVVYPAANFGPRDTSGGTTPWVTPYPDLIKYSSFQAGVTGTITLGGLTSTKQYQVQLWSTYWSDENTPVHNTIFDGAGGVALWDWRTPQYSIGTFTADAATQVITIDPGRTGYSFSPGALQVRLVPEPSTCALGALGLALCARRHRRRAH